VNWIGSSLQAGTEESRSRSDALKSLIWPLALSLAATAGGGIAASLGAPHWIPYIPAGLSVVFGSLYAVAFGYFAVCRPDDLRSESYTLKKMAIEKGLLGDSSIGLQPTIIGHQISTSQAAIESKSDSDK
jgi:predicted anti-sigma-YlaC factor YlaD